VTREHVGVARFRTVRSIRTRTAPSPYESLAETNLSRLA